MNRQPAFWRYLTLSICCLALLGCQPSPQESYERGVAALERGDWAAAAQAFEAAGDLADAPERAAAALAQVTDVESHYELARQSLRDRRWYDAYLALQRVLAADPEHEAAQRDLARAASELETLLTKATERLESDDPAAAAALYEQAGNYRQADQHAQAARALTDELETLYGRMTSAAQEGDWATALQQWAALSERAPRYRDTARLRAKYLSQGYRAAEQALAAKQQTEALHLLTAVATLDPAYQNTRQLLKEARVHAVDELVGVYPSGRLVGKHRGRALRLDVVEVRPEGELLVHATVTNITSMRNHLNCPQNDGAHPSIYLLPDNGQQVLPRQWVCQQWAAQEWDLDAGESMSFWWLYPALDDLTTPFTLAFEPWGTVKIDLLNR